MEIGYLILKINQIVNEPGTTWKVRRALLHAMSLDEDVINKLVPAPEGDFHPSDY